MAQQFDGDDVIELRGRGFFRPDLGVLFQTASEHMSTSKAVEKSDRFPALMKAQICFCCAPENSEPQQADKWAWGMKRA